MAHRQKAPVRGPRGRGRGRDGRGPLGAIRIKRVYDAPAAGDGIRVLVDRLWPRGIAKAAAQWHRWMPELAPSTELRKWYGHDPARGTLFGLGAGVAYVGFLLLLRHGGADLRRPAGPLFDATAVATVLCVAAGLVIGDADLAPSWPGAGSGSDARSPSSMRAPNGSSTCTCSICSRRPLASST